jgi:hypothetical protein
VGRWSAPRGIGETRQRLREATVGETNKTFDDVSVTAGQWRFNRNTNFTAPWRNLAVRFGELFFGLMNVMVFANSEPLKREAGFLED